MMWVTDKRTWNPLISDFSRFHGIRLSDIEDDLIDSRSFFAYASQLLRYEDGALYHYASEQQESKSPKQHSSGAAPQPSTVTNDVPPEYLQMQTNQAYGVTGG